MRLTKHLLLEDARTEFFETAALIGVICPNTLVKTINKFLGDGKADHKKRSVMLKKIQAALKGNQDWSKQGVQIIKDMTPDDPQLIDLCCLIRGMNKYMSEIGDKVVGSSPKFIHNRINDYYAAEKKALGVIKGAKANTADCIIFNKGSVDDVLKAMEKGPVKPDKALEYINLPGGYKLLSVSLKKSEKGAQLGKVTTFLKTGLGYGDNTETAVKQLSSTEYLGDVLSEGVWDKIKGIATDVWDKVKSSINKIASSFSNKWNSIFNKKPKSEHVREFFMEAGLTESSITDQAIDDLLNEAINAPTQQVIDNLSKGKGPEKAVMAVNRQIKKLTQLGNANTTVSVDATLLKKPKKFKTPTTAVFTLISNYLTVRTLIDMLEDSKKLGTTVNRLVAEMMFGGTKLPLWKVYGDYGDGHAYTYLGTIDTFIKNKTVKPKLEVIGIRITPLGEYYTIAVVMLESISDKGKKFIFLRTGTNSSSRITFIFEGTKVIGPYPLKKPIKEIVGKKVK